MCVIMLFYKSLNLKLLNAFLQKQLFSCAKLSFKTESGARMYRLSIPLTHSFQSQYQSRFQDNLEKVRVNSVTSSGESECFLCHLKVHRAKS